MIIGTHGRKGAGKDTATAHFKTAKFAAGLKAMLTTLLKLHPTVTDELVQSMIEGHLKEVPTSHLAGKTPRIAMVGIGMWAREQLAPDYWVQLLEAQLVEHERVSPRECICITDVRFPNEAEMIRRLGGFIVEIVRPEAEPRRTWLQRMAPSLFREHASERPLPRHLVDVTVVNDGSAEDLQDAFLAAVEDQQLARLYQGHEPFDLPRAA